VLRDAQLGEAVVVQDGDVLGADLVDVDVRGDVLRLVVRVAPARLRVEPGEELPRDDLFQRDVKILDDVLVASSSPRPSGAWR
jgi:hypothetical protein